MNLEFKTIGQELFLERIAPVIASESVNYLTASFAFDDPWIDNGYVAVFCLDPRNITEENTFPIPLGVNNSCVIPSIVLQNRGRFFVGVFGIKGTGRITSTFVEMTREQGAWYDSTYTPEDKLTLIEQMISIIAANRAVLEMYIKDLREDLNAKAAAITASIVDGNTTINKKIYAVKQKIKVTAETNVIIKFKTATEDDPDPIPGKTIILIEK